MCYMLWLRKLAHTEIDHADEILGVITDEEIAAGMDGTKPTQNGGMRCYLTDSTKVRARALKPKRIEPTTTWSFVSRSVCTPM